jgi:uncharacterized membrane protein YbjE (DUF340 family)|tara:strand:- start:228 stop:563 length:336 start_codon:yes stop_codon:yes gene_type:complete
MKESIINFLSSRINLTMFQCILYGIVGYVMGQYLDWTRLVLMLVVMYLIQIITRTKAVADGMVMRQVMLEHEDVINDVIQNMHEERDNLKKTQDKMVEEVVKQAKKNNDIN